MAMKGIMSNGIGHCAPPVIGAELSSFDRSRKDIYMISALRLHVEGFPPLFSVWTAEDDWLIRYEQYRFYPGQ